MTKFSEGSKFRKKTQPFLDFLKWITDIAKLNSVGNKIGDGYVTQAALDEFKRTAHEHLDLYKVAAYYIFCMRLGMVDSIERNNQFKTYDGQHWHCEPWDIDIAIGNKNTGGNAFDVNGRGRRCSYFVKTRIWLYVFASSRRNRSKTSKNRFASFITFAAKIVREHSSSRNSFIIRIRMNRNMKIRAKLVRFGTAVLHRIILAKHYLDAVSFKCCFASFSNFTALNIFCSVTIRVFIFSLIRRR